MNTSHPVFKMSDGSILSSDTVWTSCHGKREKLINMSGMHLVNLYIYLNDRCAFSLIPECRLHDNFISLIVLSIINCRSNREKLLRLVVEGKQVPHKKDGKEYKFNFLTGLQEVA